MTSPPTADTTSHSSKKAVTDIWIECAFSFLFGVAISIIGFAAIIHAKQAHLEEARRNSAIPMKEPEVRNFYKVESEGEGKSQLNVISLRFDRIDLKFNLPEGEQPPTLSEDIIMQFREACEIILYEVVTKESSSTVMP